MTAELGLWARACCWVSFVTPWWQPLLSDRIRAFGSSDMLIARGSLCALVYIHIASVCRQINTPVVTLLSLYFAIMTKIARNLVKKKRSSVYFFISLLLINTDWLNVLCAVCWSTGMFRWHRIALRTGIMVVILAAVNSGVDASYSMASYRIWWRCF